MRYGRIEIEAKLSAGDWLLSQLMMFPAENYYGEWPASGEIDIGMVRGNNVRYDQGQGNQQVSSQLHWGLDTSTDRWQGTSGIRQATLTTFHRDFHTFGLEWSPKYIFTWVDRRIAQVSYVSFDQPRFTAGGFTQFSANGSEVVNPWDGPGTSYSTPFDRPFYLTIALAVGGTTGWFPDGIDGKPWSDDSISPRKDFWHGKSQWYPTWEQNSGGELLIKRVSMWQQCDRAATDLSHFT